MSYSKSYSNNYNSNRYRKRNKNPGFLLFSLGGLIILCLLASGIFQNSGESTLPPKSASKYLILDPQETYLVNLNNAHSIEVTAEPTILSSFFTEVPALIEAGNYQLNKSFLLKPYYYEYREFYLKTGSNINLEYWSSANQSINFFIIKGDSAFNQFEDPDSGFSSADTEYYTSFLSHIYFSSDESDYYYFVWQNSDIAMTINYTIDMNLTEYDVSNPHAWKTGRFNQEKSLYPYMVLKNTDNSSTQSLSYQVEYETTSQNSGSNFGKYPQIYTFVAILVIVGLIGIFVSASRRSHANSTTNYLNTPVESHQPISQDSSIHVSESRSIESYPHVDISQKGSSLQSIPISCNLCGAHLDEDSLKLLISNGYIFCPACGTKISF
ncbi:MAG: E3 ubiquitin-protein ligase APD1-4 domain-containing protein [Promethearchaeota archaeon]